MAEDGLIGFVPNRRYQHLTDVADCRSAETKIEPVLQCPLVAAWRR